ncbi:MAG: hypothetical protein VX589_06440 [Myxococcota bacterium]|nr:hypothetical protein [Myxococcota bacterium]
MASRRRVAKMFGALVLGGSMLARAEEPPTQTEPTRAPSPAAEPARPGPPASTEQTAKPAPAPRPSPAPAPPSSSPPETSTPSAGQTYCQLELTHNQYDRARVKTVKTCLDGKTDAEILKVIKEAQMKTCQSPFCGCWLG